MRSIAFAIGLVLFFLMGFGAKPVKVLLAGDSTMSDKPLTKSVKDAVSGETFEEPFLERGWGQLLPQFLNENAGVVNYARNGRSSRTFVEEGLWTELINNAGKGDFVIIQFGHNDEVPTKKSYTEPAQFRLNFVAFVNAKDEILECHYLAGDFDYLIKIVTESTETLEYLLRSIKSVPGVQKTQTIVTLCTVKNVHSVLPLDETRPHI